MSADERDARLIEVAKSVDAQLAVQMSPTEGAAADLLARRFDIRRYEARWIVGALIKVGVVLGSRSPLDVAADVVGDLVGDVVGDGAVPEITSSRTRFSTQSPGHGRVKGYAPWKPQAKTRKIVAQVKQIIAHYEDELPLTARQIFYRLVGAYGYPKTEQAYERLTNYLVRARRAGMIPFEHIRDDGASVMKEKHYASEEDFYSAIRKQGERYERDKLANQKRDIRVYCEAAGMMPQLRRVTRRYSVPVFSCSGFDSVTAKEDLASDVMRAFTYRGRQTVILHAGDLDPSGETIFDAIAEDVYAFLEVDVPHKDARDVVIFERVALTDEQVREYEQETGAELPWAPPKDSSHAKNWNPDRKTYQLEALPPDRLAAILAEAIEDHLDLAVLEADRAAELDERRKIAKALPAPSGAFDE